MFSGKKPVAAASAAKKVASATTGGGKKADGPAQTKKDVEPEDVEPSEMNLEEIKSRIGSLIQVYTAKLKGTAWKERLEALYLKNLPKDADKLISRLAAKVDIFSQLQNASEVYRTYIKEGLA
ncbi:hypothetical protein Lser_V15G28604 [Lactuca serriola]